MRGPAPPVGELPVTGAAAGRTSRADATPSDGGAAGSGTDGPPPVQTFVPPEDGALTEPHRTGGSTAGTTSDPTGGTGGPLVAPDHAPLPPAEDGPATAALVGGYPNAPDATGDAADGGPPDATSAPAPPPLVVSRLVGERPVRLLTGAVPDVPAPPRPSVQRVTWQHDETAATPVSGPPRPEPGHLVEPEVPLRSAAAPEGTGTFTVAGSPGAAGPVPVQRWVGALPDASPPRRARPVAFRRRQPALGVPRLAGPGGAAGGTGRRAAGGGAHPVPGGGSAAGRRADGDRSAGGCRHRSGRRGGARGVAEEALRPAAAPAEDRVAPRPGAARGARRTGLTAEPGRFPDPAPTDQEG